LSYEAYIPMAKKELLKLCNQTVTRFPSIVKIAAHHVVGVCPVSTASVVLACSSPHRRDALHGIEYLIDTLKAQIPIWKLEHYEGDDSVWKENIEWKQSRDTTGGGSDDGDKKEAVRVMVRQEDQQQDDSQQD
jgi:molybdopterin synthase catalytic subunit